MIKKILALLIAFAICISPVFALSIPTQDDSIYVNDYSNVLSAETEKELISINQSSDYDTDGYVVVATFDFVDEDLYDFSYRLFNEWGVGSSEYNNGILLVLDIGNDNYCYILGTGIEQIMSDYEVSSIIDTYMEPDFAKKDYDSAVLKTTKQFLEVIEDEDSYVFEDGYYEDEYYYDDDNDIVNTIDFISFILFSLLPEIIFIVVLIIVVTSIIRSRRTYGHPSYVPPRRSFWLFGPSFYHHHHHHHHDHGMRRPSGGTFRSSSGGFTSRSSSSRSSFGGTRSSGGFRSSGGGRSHSGGRSRGGGGTRR